MTALPARGEVWWCEMAEIGRRPVVVLSRDAAIPRLRRALVAPCTTTIRGLASEVVLEPGSDPIPRRSAVNLDSVESVSVAVLVNRLGRLVDTPMQQTAMAMFDGALGAGGARSMIARLQGRMAAPEEMAGIVVFLLSDDASMITGTTQIADGGTIAALW